MPAYARRVGVAVVLATLLAIALRLADLGGKSFWLDEAFSVALARAPWPSFVYELRTREANMALYYVILRPWLGLGLSESSVRLLSAIAGIATIPVVYAIGARLFGGWAGVAAAFVLALDPAHVGLSQDARSYTLAVLLVACSTLAFVHLVDAHREPSGGHAAHDARPSGADTGRIALWSSLYVVASAGAVYAHLYAALVLVAQFLSVMWLPGRAIPWRRLVVCAASVALLLVPMAAFLLGGRHTNLSWLASEIPYLIAHGLPHIIAGYALTLVAVAWMGWRMLRSRKPGQDAWPYVLTLLWLGTPIILPLLITAVIKPVFDARYAAVSIPAIALLAGAFVVRVVSLLGRQRAIALAAAIAALELFGDWSYFARFEKEDWRGATQTVLASAAPGDVVAFYAPYVRRPYDYYVDRLDGAARAPTVLYPSKGYASLTPSDGGTMTLADAIARAEQRAPRTWLVLGHAQPDTACQRVLESSLRETYRVVEERRFVGVEVWLFANRAADPSATGRFDQVEASTIRRQCSQT